MAVWWDAAIFDLLGAFWSLLAIWFYLRYRNDKNYRCQNFFLTIFLYYLAIRTKEMFCILPLLFVLYEVWEMTLKKRSKGVTRLTQYCSFILLVYLGILFYLKFWGEIGITNDANSLYYQSFNPVKMIRTLLRYSILCFDQERGGWGYLFSTTGLIGTALLLCGLLIGIFKAIVHKKFGLLFCYIAIGISIVIVLPMVNQVHVLYLYFPAIFVGMLIAGVINGLKVPDYTVFIVLFLFLVAAGNESNIRTKEMWISNAKFEAKVWNDIKNLEAPSVGSTIYIKNMDGDVYTPFFYGEGAVCKLLYNDKSLNVEMLTIDNWNQVEYTKPYVLWEYKEGRIYEIERNDDRVLFINEVYQYPQEDGSLVISVVPDKISDPMKIYVDGTEMKLIIGETFTAVSIPSELIEGKESVALKIEDKFGTLSDEYILQMNE